MKDTQLNNFRIQKLYEMKNNIHDYIKKFNSVSDLFIHLYSDNHCNNDLELNELYKRYGKDNVQREIKIQLNK